MLQAVPLVALVGVSAGYARAQYTTGISQGSVMDATHAAVAGASVDLLNLQTAQEAHRTTGADGLYTFASLPPGTYRVHIAAAGFSDQTFDLELAAGQSRNRLTLLQIGAAEASIAVEAYGTDGLDTTDPLRGVVRNQLEVATLPNLQRNIVALVTLAPGATPTFNPRGGGLTAISGAQAGQINANGGRSKATSTQLDYTDANDWEFGGIALATQPTPDMLAEVEVLTGNWAAEYGVHSSAEVLMVTRAGTDALHGTAYDFLQNAALNARDYFDTTGRATARVQNIYGFAVGGPLRRHRAFWFAGYEGRSIHGAGSTLVVRLPTLLARESATGAAVGDLLAALPLPTTATADPLIGTLNVQAPNPSTGNQYLLRLDSTLNERHGLTLRYYSNAGQSVLRVSNSLPQYDASFQPVGKNAMVQEIWAPLPTLTNELRLAYGRSSTLFTPLTDPATPRYNVTGLTAFGTVEYWPQGRIFNVYQGNDSVTLVRGGHTVKAGVDLRFIQDNSLNQTDSRGVFTFASVSALLAGTPALFTQRFGNTYRGYRQHFHGAFVQDSWKLRPELTVDAGLRWEFQGAQHDANGLQAVLDTESRAPIGGLGSGPLGSFLPGNAAVALAHANNRLPGPRFGFVWSPGAAATVLRGGYGVYFDALLFEGLQEGRTAPPTDYTGTLTTFAGGNTLAALLAGTSPFQKALTAQLGTFNGVTNLGSVVSSDPRVHNSYTQQFSLGVQQGLGRQWLLDMAYVGTRGSQLSTYEPANSLMVAGRPAPATSAADQAARLSEFRAAYAAENGPGNKRLDPRFNDVSILSDRGSSTFHSLQASLSRSVARGFLLRAGYTWSHGIDNSSDSTPAQSSTDFSFAQNQFRPERERGNSSFDVRHRFVLTEVWELPWLKGRRDLVGQAFGGWTFASINQVQSGIPFTVLNGPVGGVIDTNLDGNTFSAVDNARPKCVAGGAFQMAAPSGRVRNTLYQPVLLGNDGTCGRNVSRLNALVNFDWTVAKTFRLGSKGPLDSGPWNLEYRADLLNALNNRYLTASGNDYRTLTSPGFGLYTSAAASRRVQMALRLNW